MSFRYPIASSGRVRLLLADVHRAAVAKLQLELAELEAKPDKDFESKPSKAKQVAAKHAAIARETAAAADCEAFGDFIDVKEQLNAGEYLDLLSEQQETTPAPEMIVDPGAKPRDHRMTRVLVAKVMAYVLGWSFVEADGSTPLLFDESTLRAVDQKVFADIYAAVEAHEDKIEAARIAEKNEKGSSTASVAS
jgi:hypothetical protein